MLAGFPSEVIEFLTDFRCGVCSKKFETHQLLIGRLREKKIMASGTVDSNVSPDDTELHKNGLK